MWIYVFVITITYYVQNWYFNYLKKSAIIYIKTKFATADLECLTILSYTDSVYRIEYNVDAHIRRGDDEYRYKWDHIVFGRAFPDDKNKDFYIQTVSVC